MTWPVSSDVESRRWEEVPAGNERRTEHQGKPDEGNEKVRGERAAPDRHQILREPRRGSVTSRSPELIM